VCYRGAAKRALWLFVAPFCDTVPTYGPHQIEDERQTSGEHEEAVRN
jgi:hypothetical protein